MSEAKARELPDLAAVPAPPAGPPREPTTGGRRYRVDYGFACGRHWMSINGKVIAQTSGDDVYLRDEDVVRLVKGTIGAPEWDAAPAAEPVAQPERHLPSNETLRQQIANDPDDEPSAGDYECTR